MSNKHNSNIILLMQTFDDICDNALKVVSDSVNLNSSGDLVSNSNSDVYSLGYYDADYWGRQWNDYDFTWWWRQPTITYHIDTPSYPKSNYSITDDGTSIIEVAVSGFNEDEITVRREDLKIIVEGKKINKEEKVKKGYVYKNIAERDFDLYFQGTPKWDYDKLKVSLKNGILKIIIPIKNECKSIYKTFEINK